MDSITRWRQLLSAQPANELARFSLAKALFDSGQMAEARDEFQRALERKPEWMMAQILLGKCHRALGEVEAARTAFERALRLAIAQDHQGPREEMEGLLAEMGGSTGA